MFNNIINVIDTLQCILIYNTFPPVWYTLISNLPGCTQSVPDIVYSISCAHRQSLFHVNVLDYPLPTYQVVGAFIQTEKGLNDLVHDHNKHNYTGSQRGIEVLKTTKSLYCMQGYFADSIQKQCNPNANAQYTYRYK